MNERIKYIKPEIALLVIGLFFGIAFLLSSPLLMIPDEPTHFLKSVALSNGHIILEKSNIFVDLYSPIPYIAPASAIFIGKLFNFSKVVLIYLGRLANLLLYIIIVYTAIRLTPVMKWVFLLLALTPMTLYEAASLSADGFTIAISFLSIALFFKLAFDDKKDEIKHKDILIIFILGSMLVLSKPIYVLLLLLFFIIPVYKFENKKMMYLNFLRILLPIIIIFMGWNLMVMGVYVPVSVHVSPINQILFILSNPIAFISSFLNTIVQNFQYYLITFIGTFGWVDTGLDTSLPNILVYTYLIILILVSLLDKSDLSIKLNMLDKDNLKIKLNQKVISLITLSIIFISIFTLEYILWTVVGKSTIDGVYGRYFIPIAPLFFVLLYNKKTKYNLKGKNWAIIIFALIVLTISLFLIVKRFHIS